MTERGTAEWQGAPEQRPDDDIQQHRSHTRPKDARPLEVPAANPLAFLHERLCLMYRFPGLAELLRF
jgi:hypothetical protein